jgi:glycosyltransferase involved in cell wall biosynthesis
LSNVVHFHGWLDRPRLAELLRTSHAYVSMSRGESWGQAVAEGLMSGLVVISAANVGASSMRRLGAPVRLVRLGDVRQLSHELRQLCHTDRQTLARQGEEGAIWAARHISRTAVAERWADVYREAIEESRALNTAQSS